MAESPAINTSPLIFLSKANLLNLLQIVSPQIIVPQAVATEIQAYGETDVTAQTLAATDWLVVTPMPPVPAVIQSWRSRRRLFGAMYFRGGSGAEVVC